MEKKTLYICAGVILALILVAVVVTLVVVLGGNDTVAARPRGPKLVIDHDGGADDAMAIFMALLYEKYLDGPQVVGLTTVNGNVNESQVYSNSQRILHIAQRRDVPIYRGSVSSLIYTHPTDHWFGYDGLGDLEDVCYDAIEAQPGHAVMALIELSKQYEGELTVATIGSLTNIALAIKLDPNFISRLSQLYVAAGTVHSAYDPDPEFNALIDVDAYYIVANNSIPDKVTIIPFSEIKHSLNSTTRDWRENVLGAIPTDIMAAQNSFERLTIVKSEEWHMLDPAAMAIVLDELLVTQTKFSENSIILCGNERGVNENNFWDVITPATNARAIFTINETAFKDFLYNIFSAELNKNGLT